MNIRLTLIVVLLLFAIASISFAQSQPSATDKENQTTQKNSAATAHQQSTENFMRTLPAVPAAKASHDSTTTNTTHQKGKENADWWIVKLTAVLAAIALLQFIALVIQSIVMGVQAKRLKQTVAATEKAANAAKASAEALPTIERAYVFITVVEWFREEDRVITEDGTEQSTVTIWLWNPGKTPAILTRLYAIAFPTGTYPDRKDIGEVSDNKIPPGGFIIKDERKWKHIEAKIRISNKQWDEIERSGRLKLLCYGRVEYKDIFGDDHETGFCWEWSPHKSHRCFYISNNKELNYYA